MLGAVPIEALLDLKMLSVIGAIARSDNTTLKDLAVRQIAVRTPKTSWFAKTETILHKYELPDTSFLIDHPELSRKGWKMECKKKVLHFWNVQLRADAMSKSTLQCLAFTEEFSTHQIWDSVNPNVKDVKRASIKVRLATGTYILQTTKARFNQNSVDPTCILCGSGDETMEHFILQCSALDEVRQPILLQIAAMLDSELNLDFRNRCDMDKVQMILDCNKIFPGVNKCDYSKQIELLTRKLCYSLHCRRSCIIDKIHEMSSVTSRSSKPLSPLITKQSATSGDTQNRDSYKEEC